MRVKILGPNGVVTASGPALPGEIAEVSEPLARELVELRKVAAYYDGDSDEAVPVRHREPKLQRRG